MPAPTKHGFGARGAGAKSACLDAKMAAGFIVEIGFAKTNGTSARVTGIDFKVIFFFALLLPRVFIGIILLQMTPWGPRR